MIALDESPLWIEFLANEVQQRELSNVRVVCSRIQDAELEPNSLDLIFARWVFSFIPEPGDVMRKLTRALRPGGVLAIEDYNHEGISIFPESEGFRAAVRATRTVYARSGGDAWIAGRAPRLFREAGLATISITPNVMCGGPKSPVFRWASAFFPHFSATLVEKGALEADERTLFLREWSEREKDEDALFFSPFLVDAAGRKP